MSDLKISQLAAGGAGQASDLLPAARGASNVSLTAKQALHLPGCRTYSSVNISIANNTLTAITFDTVRWDTDSMVNIAGHPTRVTFNTAGVYLVTASTFWAQSPLDSSYRTAVIILNGDTVNGEIGEHLHPNASANSPGNATAQTVSTIWSFAQNDYVELYVQQGSGGSLNIGGGLKPKQGAELAAQMLVAT